jgi:hypothetical protein
MNSEKTFDPTKPVETRDGRAARIICTDKKGGCPILALVETNLKGGREYTQYYNNDGSSAGGVTREDLVNVPVRTSKFANVYTSGVGSSYRSLDEALLVSLYENVPVLEIQYEDDEVVNVVFHKETSK